MIKNKRSFEEACSLGQSNNLHPSGIGEYREKPMHAILKNYYESDSNKQEIKIEKFTCDIQNEYGIIEIQTRNFNCLREKLTCFLEYYDVTIVTPLISNKFINWANSENEKDYMRKSPRHDNIIKASRELYKIKMFMNHPRLHFVFVFCDVIELKNLDGWSKDKKKGSSSVMKIPTKINQEIMIDEPKDFLKYIVLKDEFSVEEFAKMNKATQRDASVFLNILKSMNLIEVIRKDGRKNIYQEVNKNGNN